MHSDTRLVKFNCMIHNQGTRKESYLDSCMFAVCLALGDLSEHAFCLLSHLDCKIKGAAPFSPFSFPNKSSSMLQMVKGWSWHQVAFGAVPLHKGKAVVL